MKEDFIVILFYKFVNIDNPEKLKEEQLKLCNDLNLKGRIIIAKEGINATLEGLGGDIEKYKEVFKLDSRFSDISFKESVGFGNSFPKLKIKVRDEIVTLKGGIFDVQKETAPKISADELDEWFEKKEDFVVLDLRNNYEVAVGKFDKTIDLKLGNFRDLPQKIDELNYLKDKKVVTVCTGDIRCEKATCLLKRRGFKNIYHIEDGIHSYMQKYPNKYFKGTLFVFDNRITTPVIEKEGREVIGSCVYCGISTENFVNDDRFIPSKKLLCCEGCFENKSDTLRKIVS